MKQKDSPGILCCAVLCSAPLYSTLLYYTLLYAIYIIPSYPMSSWSITPIFTEIRSSLREFGSMDLFTYHTLMMGHTKLGRHQKVLTLYNEALESSAKVWQWVRVREVEGEWLGVRERVCEMRCFDFCCLIWCGVVLQSRELNSLDQCG